jgi:pimeloyl-ACP methyl ester carboxylesterase
MAQRRIHTLHRPAQRKTDAPALVFVHGGYMDARCWDIHFLPYFSTLGYDCHALDLAGHGRSEGRENPDRFGIDDFADDLRQVIAGVPGDVILVGHSMGCAVVERVLEDTRVAGAVLMAPVPPTGTQGSIMRLALKHPELFSEIVRISRHGALRPESLELMRDVYFSPVTEPHELLEFTHLIQPESEQAVADMLTVGIRRHRLRPRLPVLVIGGQCDAVFPPSAISFTAVRWNARHQRIANCGHMLMLEHQWRAAADAVAHWLATAC